MGTQGSGRKMKEFALLAMIINFCLIMIWKFDNEEMTGVTKSKNGTELPLA